MATLQQESQSKDPTYPPASELSLALRRAATAHGQHEVVREQSGEELPQ